MSDTSADRDPLDRLAEEFVARLRAGQRPSLTEYAERHPELAEPIRDLFPALVEMEQLKPATGEKTGAFVPSAASDPVRVGEFRIVRRVGRGGMGVVYEAVQESLGRHVALKILPPESLADPKRQERFRREARAAARLHHTNIVPVFGVGEADGRSYYAMQFISGHPLDAVIDEVKRLQTAAAAPRAVSDPTPAPRTVSRPASVVAAAIVTGTFARTAPPAAAARIDAATHSYATGRVGTATLTGDAGSSADAPVPEAAPPALSGSLSESGRHFWDTVARIGAQVADALSYAHGQGVLHRDIKPANLLLDLRGIVWVADFGLAKAADTDDLTHTGDIVGTLRYMAPERFDGAGDHRADIYALGLTLYELLTLTPAFVADNRAKLVEQVLTAAPPTPRSINPAIPRDLETIVLKAIARDPAMRYASAGEMAEDLRRYQEDRPIRARRASRFEQAWRWCRRNPAVAALLTAVVVVCATGAGVSAYFADDALRQTAQYLGQKEIAESETKDKEAALTKAERETKDKEAALNDSREKTRQAEEAQGRAEKAAGEADRERAKAKAAEELKTRQLAMVQLLRAEPVLRTDPGLALALLRDEAYCPPALRDETWRYLERQADRWELGRLRGHSTPVSELEFSADGKLLASGSWDGTVRVWDAGTGGPVAVVPVETTERPPPVGPPRPPFKGIAALTFSPDSGLLAIASANGFVRLWDVATRRVVRTLALESGEVAGLAFSPDGKLLALAVGVKEGDLRGGKSLPGAVELWDPKAGMQVARLDHKAPVTAVAFSPDGKTLAAGAAGKEQSEPAELFLWDVAERKKRAELPEHTAGIGDLAYSPDGRFLASVGKGWLDRTIRIWDTATNRRVALLDNPAGAQGIGHRYRLRFSPDGRTLVTNATSGLRIWDARTWQVVTVLRGVSNANGLALSPDGAIAATGDPGGDVRLWDIRTPRPAAGAFQFAHEVYDVTFLRDGRTLAVGSFGYEGADAGGLTLLDTRSGEEAKIDLGRSRKSSPLENGVGVYALSLASDGRLLAAVGSDGGVRRIDLRTRTMLPSPHDTRPPPPKTSPTGTVVWANAMGNPYWVTAGAGGVLAASRVKLDEGGRWMPGATGELDLLDATTGARRPLPSPPHNIRDGTFSPDGRTLALAGDGGVRIWNVETHQTVATLTAPDLSVLNTRGLALSPDGRSVALGCSDGGVRVWDIGTRQLRHVLRGHEGVVTALAYAPSGRTLASGGADGAVRFWDADGGELRTTLRGGHEGIIHALSFSPDGSILATGGARRDIFRDSPQSFRTGGIQGFVQLWDLGAPVPRTPEGTVCKGHTGAIKRAVVTAGGRRLVTVAEDQTVRVWEIPTGRLLTTLDDPFGRKARPDNGVELFAVSPDGETLATVSRKAGGNGQEQPGLSVVVWNARTGRPERELIGTAAQPAGPTVANPAAERPAPVGSPDAWPSAAEFSPDGQRLTVRFHGPSPAVTWTLADGKIAPTDPPPPERSVRTDFTPDGAVRVEIRGDVVALVDTQAEARVLAERLALGPFARHLWHAEHVRESVLVGDPFAAHFHLDRLLRADPASQTTLALFQQRLGELANAGRSDKESNDAKEAEITAVIENRVRRCEEKFPPDDPRTQDARLDLAIRWWFADKRDRAVQLAAEAVAARRRAGANSLENARGLEALANMYFNLNKGEEGEELYEELLRVYWANNRASHPTAIQKLEILVERCKKERNYAKAERLLAASLAPFEADPNTRPDNVAALLNQLGLLHMNRNQYARAIPYFEKALAQLQLVAGSVRPPSGPKEPKPQGPQGAPDSIEQWHVATMINLANAYAFSGRTDAAARLLEGFERRWGGTADYTSARLALASGFARLYEQIGQPDKLESLLRDLVTAAKKSGDRSPQTAGALAEYGLFLLGRKKWADAESVLRECLAIREKVIPNEWVTFNARSMLGESLMGQGKYADARPLLVAGYEGLKAREAKVPPDARVRMSQAADRLVGLAEATGSTDELVKWRAERAKYPLELAPPPRAK